MITDGKAVFLQSVFETDYKQATALELATGKREKKVTSEELVKLRWPSLNAVENPTLNAVITFTRRSGFGQKQKLYKIQGRNHF